jgi:PPM family protein phosphatase
MTSAAFRDDTDTREFPCPRCTEACLDTDRFCERCGMPLADSLDSDDSVDSDDSDDSDDSAGREPALCRCGEGDPDPDGYCNNCGRRLPGPADHAEIDLGARGALVSDRGLRHPRNEDAGTLIVGVADALVAVVADGVSSSDEPHKAAMAATAAAAAILARAERADDKTLLAAVNAAAAAVAAITDVRLLNPDGTPKPSAWVPACTLVAAHLTDRQLAVVSIGDSRAYWIPTDGPTEQVSIEDSWASEAIAAGVERAEAYADPRSHQITAWIGLDAGPMRPHIVRRAIDGSGVVVLCSDGLWNYAPLCDQLAALVRRHLADAEHRPLPAARSLTEFARSAGGRDNITIAVIPVFASTYPDHGS